MPGYYQAFPYAGLPPVALPAINAALRVEDPTAALVGIRDGVATVKSNAEWTPERIDAVHAVLDGLVAPSTAADPVPAGELDRLRAAVTLLASRCGLDRADVRRVLDLLTPPPDR